jgi:hypothetical protein
MARWGHRKRKKPKKILLTHIAGTPGLLPRRYSLATITATVYVEIFAVRPGVAAQ